MVQHRCAAALAATGCVLVAGAFTVPGASGAPAATSQSVNLSLGHVFGGFTSQDFPVILEARTPLLKRLVGVAAAVRLECATGGGFTVADAYRDLKVDRQRRFQASFGPETRRNDDGTTTEIEGSVRGRFNRTRTLARGAWEAKATERDAAGAVTDSCESGRVTWRARQ